MGVWLLWLVCRFCKHLAGSGSLITLPLLMLRTAGQHHNGTNRIGVLLRARLVAGALKNRNYIPSGKVFGWSFRLLQDPFSDHW
jgi:hypothetical protein